MQRTPRRSRHRIFYRRRNLTVPVLHDMTLLNCLPEKAGAFYHDNHNPKSCTCSLPLIKRPFLLQAVFFQVVHTPIKLLTVPANPTMPSSKFAYPRAVLGTVKSHRSEISWSLVAVRSLSSSVSPVLQPSRTLSWKEAPTSATASSPPSPPPPFDQYPAPPAATAKAYTRQQSY